MRGLLLWLCSHFRSTTYPPFSFLTEKGGYGVVGLHDGIERFYWPRMILLAQPDATQTREHEGLP